MDGTVANFLPVGEQTDDQADRLADGEQRHLNLHARRLIDKQPFSLQNNGPTGRQIVMNHDAVALAIIH